MGRSSDSLERQAPRPRRGPLPRDLVRALEWLKPRLSEPLRLDDLARAAGVPARTLETHFGHYLGTTPLGWVRQVRLAHARRQLLKGDDASITGIALASGFSQLGRFAGQYRAAYGELPSQTRSRVRVADGEVDDEATFLAWRALSSAYFVSAQECGRALDDVARAQEIAPRFGLPKAIEAWCSGQRAAFNFDRTSVARAQIAQRARDAAALAPDSASTLTVCSGAMALAHRVEEADRLIERATALDPTSPLAWIRRGWISAYLGDTQNALREFSTALYILPFEPITHIACIGVGCAHFGAERYDRAARWTREGVESHPGSFWGNRIAAAAAIHCGARDEARRIARSLLRKDPNLTVSAAGTALPFTPAINDRLSDGLRAAGVPLQ